MTSIKKCIFRHLLSDVAKKVIKKDIKSHRGAKFHVKKNPGYQKPLLRHCPLIHHKIQGSAFTTLDLLPLQ